MLKERVKDILWDINYYREFYGKIAGDWILDRILDVAEKIIKG